MTSLNSESVLQFIQNAYKTMDQIHLSMPILALIALVVTITFLFAVREVVAWFLKVDDLKKDIRLLEDSIARLEVEVRSLHQNNKGAEPAPLNEEPSAAKRRSEQFPITF